MNFLSIEPIRGDRVLIPEDRIRHITIEPERGGGEGCRIRLWTWRPRTFHVSNINRIQSLALDLMFPAAPTASEVITDQPSAGRERQTQNVRL